MRYQPLAQFGASYYAFAELMQKKHTHEIAFASYEAMLKQRELFYHFRFALRRSIESLTEQQSDALKTLNKCRFLMDKDTCTLTVYKKPPLEIDQ